MPTAAASLVPELEHESVATRRVLERVPAHQLDFRPHPKSMSLGQLALHVATIPGMLAHMAATDVLDAATVDFTAPSPGSAAELMSAHDAAVDSARSFLTDLDDARAQATWRLTRGDRELFAMPRLGLLRSLMFNHLYHHRGQLVVYLRLLDVPLPSVYGPTADENPFAN
jgi:uncharacterized damage-inducible protein DinB